MENSISRFLHTKMLRLRGNFIQRVIKHQHFLQGLLYQSALACALDRFNALEAELNFFSCALQNIYSEHGVCVEKHIDLNIQRFAHYFAGNKKPIDLFDPL